MEDKEENKDINVAKDAFDGIGKEDVAERLLEKAEPDSRRLISSLSAETGGITVGPSIQANSVNNVNYYITASTARDKRKKSDHDDEPALEEPDSNKRKIVCQQNYKKEVEKKYGKMKDYNSLTGEWVDFNKRYTNMLILRRHLKLKEREDELKSRGHLELRKKYKSDEAMCIQVEDVFASDENGEIPSTVVLQGPAGIGKTFTVNKIMFDWASKNIFQGKFDYVFHFDFRELNTKGDVSLIELLSDQYSDLNLKEILACPEKLLFLMDGFDEWKFPLDQGDVGLSGDERTKQPVAITVSRLLKRKILSKSTLLITTRSSSLETLDKSVTLQRFADLLGFSADEIQEYVFNYFQAKEQAAQALNYIKENESVLTLCFVPVVCWIICELIKHSIDCGEELNRNLKTATQVFVHFVITLCKHHGNNSPSDIIHKLGPLALEGVRKQQFLFQEEELERLISSPVQGVSAFLSKIQFKQGLSCGSAYHFLHLSIQELFAAMFCVSGMSEEEINTLLNDCIHNSCLLNVVQFMFGLANKNIQALIPGNNLLPISVLRTRLENWIKEASSYVNIIELLHCLFEIQDEEFVKKAMADMDELWFWNGCVNKNDCTVIKYCIEQRGEVERLDLASSHLEEEEVKVLVEVLPKCKIIEMHSSHLTKDTVMNFCQMLSTHPCWVSLGLDITLRKEGLTLFCFTFDHVIGQEGLSFEGDLTEDFILNICTLIIPKYDCKSISVLNPHLTSNFIEKLCGVFKMSTIDLQSLELTDTHLTDSCVESLSSGLNAFISSLECLDLSNNSFTDSCVPSFIHIMLMCTSLRVFNVKLFVAAPVKDAIQK
ncbi:NACHT, LRR and PYD domains-containing protein 3-like isoform X2 [Acipenser ruthenus]|uniref:NACHT, LRR and PYD domains-containing protein 3-like isoform X2 n=1 Tax=Acipenser ruthenus TaxID=7906 RepID=UPI0027417935|nr:NACHT, LRR and PYD domains-containing protein 3-like isoform X2 [Acipenser ruthenus]